MAHLFEERAKDVDSAEAKGQAHAKPRGLEVAAGGYNILIV